MFNLNLQGIQRELLQQQHKKIFMSQYTIIKIL